MSITATHESWKFIRLLVVDFRVRYTHWADNDGGSVGVTVCYGIPGNHSAKSIYLLLRSGFFPLFVLFLLSAAKGFSFLKIWREANAKHLESYFCDIICLSLQWAYVIFGSSVWASNNCRCQWKLLFLRPIHMSRVIKRTRNIGIGAATRFRSNWELAGIRHSLCVGF